MQLEDIGHKSSPNINMLSKAYQNASFYENEEKRDFATEGIDSESSMTFCHLAFYIDKLLI